MAKNLHIAGSIGGESPKKLSDLENDLFYSKRTPFLTITEKDCEPVYRTDNSGNNTDEIVGYQYVGSPKLDWLKSLDDIYIRGNLSIDLDGTGTNVKRLIFNQTMLRDIDYGMVRYKYIEEMDLTVIQYLDGIGIFNGGNPFTQELFDGFTIMVFGDTKFTLEIFRVEEKSLPTKQIFDWEECHSDAPGFISNKPFGIVCEPSELFSFIELEDESTAVPETLDPFNAETEYFSYIGDVRYPVEVKSAEDGTTYLEIVVDDSSTVQIYTDRIVGPVGLQVSLGYYNKTMLELDPKYVPSKMNVENPVGTGSFSMNRKEGTVIGENSHTEGSSTTASGSASHAEGSDTKATQAYSHAEGKITTASGIASHTEGANTKAAGDYSHAEGFNTEASGESSHSEGYSSKALGQGSHVEGTNTAASGSASHAEGSGTTASGRFSHAEGSDTKATQAYSHAEGKITTASGGTSHAEGSGTTASGGASHAEGNGTTASGDASHAEGINTKASGRFSHAEGRGTKALSNNQHVQGSYNISDSNAKYAHIVGNGESDSVRSNAHTLGWDGTGWFAGNLYVGGTGQDDANVKKLATEEYVTNSLPTTLPNPNALTFTGAVSGSYDGSAPVSVEIPSGGGSGSAENWRLVNTVTMPVDVSYITITQDSDGNPLSLKKVKIFVKMRGNSANLSDWCRITVNSLKAQIFSDIQNTFAATEGQDYYHYSRADFAIYAGRVMLELLLRSLNNQASKKTLYFTSNTGCSEDNPSFADAITGIDMWSPSAGIGAGTELMIYGVDA